MEFGFLHFALNPQRLDYLPEFGLSTSNYLKLEVIKHLKGKYAWGI